MKQKSRVFVTGSLWSLLIYLVANDLDCIKRTWYFLQIKVSIKVLGLISVIMS